MNLCYMSGYGIEIEDLQEFLDDKIIGELENSDVFSVFEDLTDNDKYISNFCSDDGEFLYIRDRAPYETAFKDINEINEYFYKKLKPYLKNNVNKENLYEKLDDVSSYDYC